MKESVKEEDLLFRQAEKNISEADLHRGRTVVLAACLTDEQKSYSSNRAAEMTVRHKLVFINCRGVVPME